MKKKETPIIRKICAYKECGCEFETRRKSKQFCSPHCRYMQWKIENRDSDLIKKALDHYRTCPLVKEES